MGYEVDRYQYLQYARPIDIISTLFHTGSISLVVTTKAAPSSREHSALLSKLIQLSIQTPLLKQTLSVHIVHLSPTAEPQPNAFLNLARLLAPSPRVVLFPGNLSYAPPKNLYRTLIAQQPSSSSAMSQPSGRARKRRPVVLTLREHTSFPFASLAPLVMPRDDATWCTERFFAGMSRAADWEECLWQVWLANFGDVEIRQTQGWTYTSQQADADPGLDTASLENPAAVCAHAVCYCGVSGSQIGFSVYRSSYIGGWGPSSGARHAPSP